MTVHLEHMSDEDIFEKFKSTTRQNMKQYYRKYADDQTMLTRLDVAKAKLHEYNYMRKYGAKKDIRQRANTLWQSMLSRCNEERQLTPDGVAYTGVTYSENFGNFEYFMNWCIGQVGFTDKDSNGYSFELDKDIVLRGNKQYNENVCVFVPKGINFFFVTRGRRSSGLPVGVTRDRHSGKYIAQMKCKELGTQYIGSFATPESAREAYKKFRKDAANSLADKWEGKLDPRVIISLRNYVENNGD
jgi:hypothetical protein